MYKFKTNKDTKALEIVRQAMTCHPSIIATKAFDEVYTREFSRHETAVLFCKIKNGTATPTDVDKYNLLCTEFSITEKMILDGTDEKPADLPEELHKLFALTLFSNGVTYEGISVPVLFTDDEDGQYSIKSARIALDVHDFYSKARVVIPQFENGVITIEDAIKALKPFFVDSASKYINHDAVKDVCKKWNQSTRNNDVRAFVLELTGVWKTTRLNNMRKGMGVLSSLETFSRAYAKWLTYGAIVEKKASDKKDYRIL